MNNKILVLTTDNLRSNSLKHILGKHGVQRYHKALEDPVTTFVSSLISCRLPSHSHWLCQLSQLGLLRSPSIQAVYLPKGPLASSPAWCTSHYPSKFISKTNGSMKKPQIPPHRSGLSLCFHSSVVTLSPN